jgi:hypothetical protein
VLVPALEVCIALLEPRRSPNDPGSEGASPTAAAAQRSKQRAVASIVLYVPQLVQLLRVDAADGATQQTPYGLLAPPLGSSRLKVCELLATLMRTAEESAEEAVVQADAFTLCMETFRCAPLAACRRPPCLCSLLAASFAACKRPAGGLPPCNSGLLAGQTGHARAGALCRLARSFPPPAPGGFAAPAAGRHGCAPCLAMRAAGPRAKPPALPPTPPLPLRAGATPSTTCCTTTWRTC